MKVVIVLFAVAVTVALARRDAAMDTSPCGSGGQMFVPEGFAELHRCPAMAHRECGKGFQCVMGAFFPVCCKVEEQENALLIDDEPEQAMDTSPCGSGGQMFVPEGFAELHRCPAMAHRECGKGFQCVMGAFFPVCCKVEEQEPAFAEPAFLMAEEPRVMDGSPCRKGADQMTPPDFAELDRCPVDGRSCPAGFRCRMGAFFPTCCREAMDMSPCGEGVKEIVPVTFPTLDRCPVDSGCPAGYECKMGAFMPTCCQVKEEEEFAIGARSDCDKCRERCAKRGCRMLKCGRNNCQCYRGSPSKRCFA